jgi:manganese-dependent ADP-ribose/CDP-alcohol diphosphatase
MAKEKESHFIRFGIITDIHFASNSAAASELRNCMDWWKRKKVDFLLQLGDLIQGSDRQKEEELRQVCSILKAFDGTIHHVIGNHCLALPREELMAALGLQTPFYTFAAQGFRFIVLDGMDVSVLRTPDTEEDRQLLAHYHAHPELHDYCGAIGIRQKTWLQQELEKADDSRETVIIICHFPLLSETTDPKHGLLWNHKEIAELIASSPAVKACISGHYHHGSYTLWSGIHFVVLPAFVNRSEHPRFTCGTIELQDERMVIRNQHDETLYDLPLQLNIMTITTPVTPQRDSRSLPPL